MLGRPRKRRWHSKPRGLSLLCRRRPRSCRGARVLRGDHLDYYDDNAGDHVHDRIQRLSPKFRAILVLRYLEHQSYEQLCETIGVSMGTVKSRLARAHIALQAELAGTLEPFGYRADTAGNYSTGTEGVA